MGSLRLKNWQGFRRYLAVFLLIFTVALSGVLFNNKTAALETPNAVNLYMFWGDGCPHCAHAKKVLEPFMEQKDFVNYHKYEVYYSAENQQKMQAVGKGLNIDASGIPLIIVGDKSFTGFSEAVGEEIKQRIEFCSTNACPDSVAEIVGASTTTEQPKDEPAPNEEKPSNENTGDKVIQLPFVGQIRVADFSLPVLTVIIGLIDGFNPCAMWALLFIITLLIGMQDRKRMWLYGISFIATSAAVYFLFMAAWLNLFMFIGHIVWIRVAIGLLALGVGGYYLYDWSQKNTGCKVTSNGKRQKTFAKLREIVKQKNIWIGLGGIILLAAAVNIVELACSAGLPVLYTGILSTAGLATWQYYAYMLLYILFFMLDDLVVFFIAMTTLKIIGVESKYSRAMRLFGGILMCILGLLLIFAPQVLMFG